MISRNPAPYRTPDGSKKMVPMMGLEEAQEFGYLKTPDYEAVELPYGESGRLRMYI